MFTIAKSSRLQVLAVSMLTAATASTALTANSGSHKSDNSSAPAAANMQATANYGKLPLSFEANQGQTDSNVKFVSRGNGYSLFLTNSAAVLTLSKGDSAPEKTPQTDIIQMQLLGADPSATVAGADQLPGIANYLLGNDPAQWHSNIPTYAKVRYSHVYNGIDLVYYGNQSRLEYDFVLARRGPTHHPTPL
jgi:hypothetical protein